ncbi:uncharacterized protein [Panulirus ornatus]|uniref:uncharacterized protein n=1 Tax=Panulirus ornatus TaxID=150431 RepID=UPI003A87CE38
MMSQVILAAVLAALLHQHVEGQECPCMYREADPVFPGATGNRWDCEYVSHGLPAVPSTCWTQHPDVTQVFLDYNEIEHLAAEDFAGLTNLQTLSLKKNSIATIEDRVFAGLTSLQFLDLSSNQIVVPPSDIWHLSNLTHLYLADNKLLEVQTYNISHLTNLEVLDLHLNQLRQIPYHSLEPLTKLRKLHLYWNIFVVLPILTENLQLEEVLVHGNALLDFPKYMFGNLSKPLTYHFVDNPAYDVWAPMLLPLPDRSHIVMGNDVSVWAEDEQQAKQLLQKDWLVQNGLSQTIDLSALVRICGTSKASIQGRLPPC